MILASNDSLSKQNVTESESRIFYHYLIHHQRDSDLILYGLLQSGAFCSSFPEFANAILCRYT